jgi:hypothetical protein
MKVKTSELIGRPLDWAVVTCGGYISAKVLLEPGGYSPSTKWSQGGPIIERERIQLCDAEDSQWMAYTSDTEFCTGPTPLIAAMRCYVASKLGDEVEIPEKLV